MNKLLSSALLFFCFISSLACAWEEDSCGKNIAVDLIYLVADLKYNHQQGIQICEIQQGRASRFSGIDFICQDTGVMAKNLAEVLRAYHRTGWFLINDIRDPHTCDALREIGWKGFEDIESLINDSEFQSLASGPICRAEAISDFGGILFARQSSLQPFHQFKKNYPNILIIDETIFEYSADKLKSSCLFANHSIAQYKPKWNLYKKIYHADLASQILEDFQTDFIVVKPRRAAKGYGVIICRLDQLDETLAYILTEKELLLENPDPSYRYWAHDKSDSFIVEAYVPSEPTSVSHLNNRFFDPTMRVVYVIAHAANETHLHHLGSYWKLPEISLDESGSLNDLHKSCGKIPFFAEVDPSLNEAAQEQVRDCLYKLYQVARAQYEAEKNIKQCQFSTGRS